MGTTSTALRAGSCVRCYVLAIEGYEYLLTSHSDTAAVVTAWAGTGWALCLPGLKVNATMSQTIRPWQDDIEVQTISVAVVPEEDDIFGKAVFKSKPSFSTRLTSTFRPAANGSGTINVKSTSGAAASGSIYVGGQKHAYSSTGAGQFNVGAAGAGQHNPFTADGSNVFAGPMTHPQNYNNDVAAPPKVSDVPPTWIGRKVGLYIHRIVNGVLDTRAQAQLEFAGRIKGYQDTDKGETVLELEDMRAAIRDAVILQKQWVGYVHDGIFLRAGTRLKAGTRVTGSGSGATDSGEFTVVASGMSGADELDEGLYEIPEILSKLDAWLAADGAIEGEWDFSVKDQGEQGVRVEVNVEFASGDPRQIFLNSTSMDLLDALGFDTTTVREYHSPTTDWVYLTGNATADDSLVCQIVGNRAPVRARFAQRSIGYGAVVPVNIELHSTEGTLHDQQVSLPYGLKGRTETGETWAVIKVGNVVYLAKFDGATTITKLMRWGGPLKYIDDPSDADELDLPYGSDQDRLAVRQVLLLAGTFTDVFTQLVASMGGTAGVNHADYDVLPWGAGIPWSLLGDDWLDSAKSLEESLNSKSIMTLVTQPTRLLDLLVPELALRFAWLVWKDEGYRFVTLPTPNSTTADHALTEANKADPADVISPGRSTTVVTTQYLRNVIKLQYARRATGKYGRTLEVIDSPSVDAYGGSKAVTLEAINSYGEEAGVGASVEEMVTALVSRVMPVFSQPRKTFRRRIAPTLFHATPGDTVSVTDDFARDPMTGERGISARAAVVLGVTYDRGQDGGAMSGEMECIFTDEDRHYPMAPAAEIDTSYSGVLDGRTFTNGYAATAAGGPAIKLKANAYSRAADPDDVTHWATGYLGRLIRLDGAVSGDAWNVTVASVDTADSYLVLSADISAPAYTASATAKYRLQFREYSACTAAQKLYAFQADDADSMIENAAQPNTYGNPQWQSFTPATISTPPNLPVIGEFAGNGEPFHPGLLHDISLFNNSLANYRTAVNTPVVSRAPIVTNSLIYQPVMSFPLFIGPPAASGYVRKLRIAPTLKTANAASTCYVRVTTSEQMPKADSTTSALAFNGAYRSAEFTSASTTLAEATEESLTAMSGEGTYTWITVEIKGTDVAHNVTTYGLSRLYIGPAEAF